MNRSPLPGKCVPMGGLTVVLKHGFDTDPLNDLFLIVQSLRRTGIAFQATR